MDVAGWNIQQDIGKLVFIKFPLCLHFNCISVSNMYLIQILYFDFLRKMTCFNLTLYSLVSCDVDVIACLLVYYT